mgnify:CR=1 FL=1
MNNVLSTLGLCRRAGKLIYGFDAVAGELEKPDTAVCGVILASDLSEKSKKEVRFICAKKDTEVTEITETLDDIKNVIGKRTGIIAVLDAGLYKSIIKNTGAARQGDTEWLQKNKNSK